MNRQLGSRDTQKAKFYNWTVKCDIDPACILTGSINARATHHALAHGIMLKSTFKIHARRPRGGRRSRDQNV